MSTGFPLQVFPSSKFLVFTRQKIASSYFNAAWAKLDINKNNEFVQLPWLVVDNHTFEFQNFGMPDGYYTDINKTHLENLKKDWEDCITHKNKKDLLFLIKHPISRFYSGWYQDYVSHYFTEKWTPSHIKTIMNIIKDDEHVCDEHVDECFNEITKSPKNFIEYFTNISPMVHNSREYVVKSLIRHSIKKNISECKGIYSPHNTLYMYIYHQLISSNILNNKKVKIINIGESNLANILNRYDVNNFSEKFENSSYDFKKMVSLIFSNEFPLYFSELEKQFETELYYYNLLIQRPEFYVD